MIDVYVGEKAVKECIAQGRKFADACQGPDKERMRKVCNDLDQLLGDLAQLRRQGKVGVQSCTRISLCRPIYLKLSTLLINQITPHRRSTSVSLVIH